MTSSVTLHVAHGGATTVELTGATITLDGRPEASNELLALAVAGCHANTLLAEAMARAIWLRGLEITVAVAVADPPRRERHMTIEVCIDADVDHDAIMDLVEHADRVSEVANAVRLGMPVNIAAVQLKRMPPAASH